jgi:uncharacterized membrane-anchored protein
MYSSASAKTFAEMFPQYADLESGDARNFLESLDYQQGKISLQGGFAELQVPDGFYYLNPEHAERVLTEAWGNPPDTEPPLGMIFPADLTPIHDGSWAVTVNWDPIGYVSDTDANEIDYSELLTEMQADTRTDSAWRLENGYEAIELLGWAAPPRYDAEHRRLHWAKELKFGTEEAHVLNYNMRILGRKGVLVMNFVAGMDALPEVKQALPDVLALASFTEGSRYSDFDASIDEVAAVGIGGLIAGKVMAKTGLLAAALIFLKKFWFLGFIALAGLWKVLTGRRS